MDFVRLNNLKFHAYHGVSKGEAADGQRFEIDVELSGSLRHAARKDDLQYTHDYNKIYEVVSSVVTGERCNLIETLAEHIASGLLAIYPKAVVKITVRKPHLPVRGVLDGAEVEITRGPVNDAQ